MTGVRALARAFAARVAPGWYQRRATLIGARTWDMVAEADEQFYAEEYLGFLRPALAGARGRRVLDLGCGQGRFAIPLAREGYDVTAVDWSEDALAAARGYAGDGPAPVFHHADVVDWVRAAPAASYDALLALEILYMLDAWRELLAEAVRVLAPGGVVAFGFRPLLYYVRYHARRGRYDLVSQVSAAREGRFDGLRFNWHTAKEVAQLLQRLGFRDVRCAAIGLASGIAGDPLEPIARPSRLERAARETLLDVERRWAAVYPDEGRYILALARR